MASTALTPTIPEDKREVALLKAVGLDRAAPEQRELAVSIARNYDLDLMLKHLVLIEGRPYITRDGLLHIAHRSGQLDGIETTEPAVSDGFWRVTCSVYRKDMSRPFTYTGRYPTSGGNQKFAPEMATKVAESMSLRRAFDVAAPAADERWDMDSSPAPQVAPPASLAERAAAKRASIETSPQPVQNAPSAEEGEFREPEVTEAPEAPVMGMGRDEFHAFLKSNRIAPGFAMSEAKRLFPDTDGLQLDDEQRATLAVALVAQS